MAARSLRLTASALWPMAAGGTYGAIEVDALDERVGGDDLRPVARRLADRRVVADPDGDPGRAGGSGARGSARSARARRDRRRSVPAGWTCPSYFAYSTARVSRMTVTLIWPGYSSSLSMRRAMSFESQTASSSRDLLALDQDADLAARLQRERLRDALERVGDPLELLEPLDVRLEDVAARARPRRRDRVGRLHEHRLERRPVDVHVVRGDRLDHRARSRRACAGSRRRSRGACPASRGRSPCRCRGGTPRGR